MSFKATLAREASRPLALPALALVCTACGAQYPQEYLAAWGRSTETTGYGPTPCCTELVKDPLGSDAVCRGALAGVPVSPEDAIALSASRTPTPIVANVGRSNA